MSKFSLPTIFIVIAAVTIGVWYLVSYNSGQPVVQPKQPKGSVVKTNTGNNRTTANEGKRGKGASNKSAKSESYYSSMDQAIQKHFEDFSKVMSNSDNYAAIKAVRMRSKLVDDQVFFRNQTITPDMRQKMLGLLADVGIEKVETVAIANGLQDEAGAAARSSLEAEYKQKLIDTLGSEMASRYDHYTKNPQCWNAVDRYVLVTAGQGTALNDDQKYAMACVMSENKGTSLVDLREKIMPLLMTDQQTVYDTYINEEKILIIGRKIEKELTERAHVRLPTK